MNATRNPRFDPVTLEILWSRLISIADESAAALLRTAFSTVVRESNDFTTVLLDAECNCLAENTGGIPSFVGMVPSAVKAMLERVPVERWRPGDCIITNDPWLGSGHLPDVTMASPIFHRGRLVGFSGSIAHLPDIGGSGWACDTRELYEEGLRLMPVKFIENDEEHQVIGDIIRDNVRVPDQVIGDLYAQVAAQRICAKGLQQFLDDTDLADLAELSAELRGRAETAMRKAIAALPDGSWCAAMDADGIDEFETHIECRMTVSGSDLELDFEGTSGQVACGINSVMKYTHAYATYPVKCALDPDSPRNEGSFQPITVKAPEGSILNPTHPAPVGARQLTGHLLYGVIYRCLAQFAPDRVVAESGSTPSLRSVYGGVDRRGNRFNQALFASGGLGASHRMDGYACTAFPSNTGVDVGGTFTDFVLVDEERDVIFTGKQLTSVSDPGIAICEGARRIAREAGTELAGIDGIVHGTTLVANTIIERTGARIGLITTRGFRDVLEVGTEMRYDLYDLFLEKAEPLAPRDRRLTVDERIDSDGNVLRPMDEAELREAARALVGMGVEALAVCFVNSYVNPVHERCAREILAESFPALPLTVSTTVAPEIREYERACTAAANAYVMPLMRRYVTGLQGKLADMGLRAPLNVMLSGGGIAALRVAREAPIQLVESGPAAGATAGAHYARITGTPSVIAFDMGGTTAKMCLIENGEPEHATTFEAGRVKRFAHGSGIPLKVPVIDLIEIGAGGGSIARLDAMGLMKVGPRSAGADPGPVCYGRGGTQPTVTDADLWLGYLSPHFFLGGEMPLDAAAVRDAMDRTLSRPTSLDTTAAAAGVHAIVNNNMAAAARRHIAEKGRDPRRYALVATGGAGPVHAYGLAGLLGIRRIICPLGAGVTSSLGFLIAAPATDRVHSHVRRVDSVAADTVNAFYDAMTRDAVEALVEAGGDAGAIAVERRVEMRHVGQGFEIEVAVPGGVLGPDLGAVLHQRFLERYDELFGRRIAGVPVETVTWRLTASGPTPNVRLHFEGQRIETGAAEKGERQVHFPRTGFAPCKVYNRYGLAAGAAFRGPAVVEERESTVVAGPDTTVSIDEHLNLIIDIDPPPD